MKNIISYPLMELSILISIVLIFTCSNLFSQEFYQGNQAGINYHLHPSGLTYITINPGDKLPGHSNNIKSVVSNHVDYEQFRYINNTDSNTTHIRYSVHEPTSISGFCALSGNGLVSVIGWYANQVRTSAYSQSNITPLWEIDMQSIQGFYNFVDVSYTGNFAVSSYNNNLYFLNGNNGSVIWTYDMLQIHGSEHWAGPAAITRNGNFVIAAANGKFLDNDTSYVYGFNNVTNTPLWTIKIPKLSSPHTNVTGLNISGNDSVSIINSSRKFYVIKTFTGQIIDTGLINPYSSYGYGSQVPQGISGDGSVIAIVNNYGYLMVYLWNGTKYDLLWEDQELPGAYYNWRTCVDVSYDGSKIAAGSLIMLEPEVNRYDGKIKFYKTFTGSTPVWEHSGDSGYVNCVSFSKNGKILSAAAWGDLYYNSADNLIVFNTDSNIPIYGVNDSGSFKWCCTSEDGTSVIGSGKAVHSLILGNGGIYYNLSVDTSASPIGVSNNQNKIPAEYKLYQNYPNPFNPLTIIQYDLPKNEYVTIKIFDMTGKEITTLVNNELKKSGNYKALWNASGFASGIYFFKIQAGIFTNTKKMVLIK